MKERGELWMGEERGEILRGDNLLAGFESEEQVGRWEHHRRKALLEDTSQGQRHRGAEIGLKAAVFQKAWFQVHC